MSLIIKRAKDNRVVKCIHNRVADIPGGVTVQSANLGGSALFEGTPIGKGASGMYEVVKTAQILTDANDHAVTYEVAKGHHFKIGDRFATSECNGQLITNIDKSNPAKDVITVGTTLGKAVKPGACAFESKGADTKLKVQPIAIAGSNEDIDGNVFVSAWVIATVNEATAPIVNDAIKAALKTIAYI